MDPAPSTAAGSARVPAAPAGRLAAGRRAEGSLAIPQAVPPRAPFPPGLQPQSLEIGLHALSEQASSASGQQESVFLVRPLVGLSLP